MRAPNRGRIHRQSTGRPYAGWLELRTCWSHICRQRADLSHRASWFEVQLYRERAVTIVDELCDAVQDCLAQQAFCSRAARVRTGPTITGDMRERLHELPGRACMFPEDSLKLQLHLDTIIKIPVAASNNNTEVASPTASLLSDSPCPRPIFCTQGCPLHGAAQFGC